MRSRKINKAKRTFPSARNHGGCPFATSSRLHAAHKRIEAASVEDRETWQDIDREVDRDIRRRKLVLAMEAE